MEPTVEKRFWSKVEKTDGCWLWTGTFVRDGYGSFWTGERTVRAHRMAIELAGAVVPPGMWVCHTCDNPPCVRPDHLYVGTVKENSLDRIASGRGKLVKLSPGHIAALQRGRNEWLATREPKPTCKNGHPFAGENLRMRTGTNTRVCLTCARIVGRATLARRNHDPERHARLRVARRRQEKRRYWAKKHAHTEPTATP